MELRRMNLDGHNKMTASEAPAYAFSRNVEATSIPCIPLAGSWAARYQATDDKPLINLSQGVPGSPPPQEFLNRIAKASSDGDYSARYGQIQGEPALREALAKDMNGAYFTSQLSPAERRVEADDVALLAGCNLAFYAVVVALAEAGSEVILPVPQYFNHSMTLTQLGVQSVSLKCRPPSFLPSVEECEALITAKTRAIVLVTPNNPTGTIYPPELSRQFAELAVRRKVPLVLDETYREFLPIETDRPHDLFEETAWRKYLIHLFSFSKSYAIPGLRLGAVVASPLFLEALNKTLDCLQICPPRPAQIAAAWAVEGIRPWRDSIREEVNSKGALFKEVIAQAEGWEIESIGAYYAYVRHPYAGVSSLKVAETLALEYGVVTLPGSFFTPSGELTPEQDRYLRISIANVPAERLHLVPGRMHALNTAWADKLK